MSLLSIQPVLFAAVLFVVALPGLSAAEPVVPGTGVKWEAFCDDFEDTAWEFVHNFPKSSYNIDEQRRYPAGTAKNDRWYEGIKRGQPDVIQRISTPDGGLAGSTGALLLRSRHTGVPGSSSFRMQQDDFIAAVQNRLGHAISPALSPSVVVRVYLPPVDEWENRTGPTFAFRVALLTTTTKRGSGFFASSRSVSETYWPGMFIDFQSKEDGNREYDSGTIRVRANRNGGEYRGRQISETGWWTLGISVSPDGMVHYYARPGIEDLTAEDRIASELPYGYRCEGFKTYFFNVCSGDDGNHWSTAWIIDDPTLYINRRG